MKENNDVELFVVFPAAPGQVTQPDTVHICGWNKDLIMLLGYWVYSLDQTILLLICSTDSKAYYKYHFWTMFYHLALGPTIYF